LPRATCATPSLRRRYHEITFATTRLTSQVYNTGREAVAYAEAPDALALVVWLHKDALIAALGGRLAGAGYLVLGGQLAQPGRE